MQDLQLPLKNRLQIPADLDSECLVLENVQHLNVAWPVFEAGEKNHDLHAWVGVDVKFDRCCLFGSAKSWHEQQIISFKPALAAKTLRKLF